MWQKPSKQIFVQLSALVSILLLYNYLYPPLGVEGVMAASYCCSWWRSWSDALWVALTSLWPIKFLLYLSWVSIELHNILLVISLPLWSFLFITLILSTVLSQSCKNPATSYIVYSVNQIFGSGFVDVYLSLPTCCAHMYGPLSFTFFMLLH